MANVIYNGNRIIPAPFVSVNKEYYTEGYKYGRVYQITLSGKILAHKGSPDSTGAFWSLPGFPPDETPDEDEHFEFMTAKVMALQELFKTEGKTLEFQPTNGAVGFRCNPRLKSLNFPEGPWYSIMDYSIVLEADDLRDTEHFFVDEEEVFYLKSANESWNIEESLLPSGTGQIKVFTVTHNISAVGTRHYDSNGDVPFEAWERAKDFAQLKRGRDDVLLAKSLLDDLSTYTEYFNARSESIDELQGSYNYTETWMFTEGTALFTENFTVTTTNDTTVQISGEIRGMAALVEDKLLNAESGFDESRILTRAQTHSGLSLNPIPYNKTIGKSLSDGLLTYNYEYDTRPSQIVSGSLTENVNVTWDDPGQVFAEIFVLGRVAGPVLQDLGTVTTKKLTVEVDILVKKGASMPNVDSYVDSFNPGGFASPPQRSWNPFTGQFRHVASWTYE